MDEPRGRRTSRATPGRDVGIRYTHYPDRHIDAHPNRYTDGNPDTDGDLRTNRYADAHIDANPHHHFHQYSRSTNTPTAPNHIVISEFRTLGPLGADDEFVELYNPTGAAVNIGGWLINKSSSCGTSTSDSGNHFVRHHPATRPALPASPPAVPTPASPTQTKPSRPALRMTAAWPWLIPALL